MPAVRELLAAIDAFAWWKYVAGDMQDGLAMSEEALKLSQAPGPWEGRERVQPARTYAFIQYGLGNRSEAVTAFEHAVRLDRDLLGDGHIFTGVDTTVLAAAYRAIGEREKARRVLEDLLGWNQDGEDGDPRPTHPSSGMLLGELGLTYLSMGRRQAAERTLREALVRYDDPTIKALGHRLWPRQRAMIGLGRTLVAQGRLAEGERVLVQAYQQLQDNFHLLAGNRAELLGEAHTAVVEVLTAAGKTEQVAEWRQRVPAGARAEAGPHD
jgi:tetratricopeptide (TPR) repeat protein